jgi:DNA-directed RNA polymerase specialized sigma24 family protein
MKAGVLNPETFARLLFSLDADRERAGEKYEELRRMLIRYFEWRGAPFPEEHADETFNRVARRLGEGIEIRNIGGYVYEVARLIFLETTKGTERKSESLESLKSELIAEADTTSEEMERELRLSCLDDCLRTLPVESAELVLEYYRCEDRNQITRRKGLAERFGLRREALANRVQRLRDKLERCVSACVRRKQRYESRN